MHRIFLDQEFISGVFELYIPKEMELVGWAVIFLMSIWFVARWGTSGEASEELEEKIEEVKEEN